jgi:hypothetical protein
MLIEIIGPLFATAPTWLKPGAKETEVAKVMDILKTRRSI